MRNHMPNPPKLPRKTFCRFMEMDPPKNPSYEELGGKHRFIIDYVVYWCPVRLEYAFAFVLANGEYITRPKWLLGETIYLTFSKRSGYLQLDLGDTPGDFWCPMRRIDCSPDTFYTSLAENIMDHVEYSTKVNEVMFHILKEINYYGESMGAGSPFGDYETYVEEFDAYYRKGSYHRSVESARSRHAGTVRSMRSKRYKIKNKSTPVETGSTQS
jgi:hypothetical protein